MYYSNINIYVYTHAHTHTAHGVLNVVLDVNPGVGTRHLECPKNGLNLGIIVYVFVRGYKVNVYIYMLGGGMRSWANFFFL